MEFGMLLKTKKKMTKSKSKFRGRVSRDAQRQKQSASSYGYLNLPQGLTVFKEEPGERVRLDILPYIVSDERHPDRDDETGAAMVGELWYKRPFRIHRSIGAGNGETVVCPQSIGKRCPICDYRKKRISEGADKKETDVLKTSLRNLYIVVPIGSKDHKEEPHIWDISQAMFQKLLNQELDERPDCEVFPDLEEGLTLYIRFDSKTIPDSSGKAGRPFAEASRIDFEERKEIYDESVLESVPDLDNVLKILTFKELELKFHELEDEEPAEEAVEDTNDASVTTTMRKPKTFTRKEEEEEDTKDPEPKEEPQSSMRRVKKPSAPSSVKETKLDKATSDSKCPSGYTFGVDCEKYDECDDCPLWDACIEEKERK
jgi:hypothetical protein